MGMAPAQLIPLPLEQDASRAGKAGKSLSARPCSQGILMFGSGDIFHSLGASSRLTFTVSKGCPRTKPSAPVVTRRCYE